MQEKDSAYGSDVSLNRELFQAAYEKDAKRSRKLLKEGADVNWQHSDSDKFSNAPIHIAAWNGDDQMCKILAEAKADLEVENQFCNTPLMFACYYGNERAVKVLLEKGAQVSAISSGTGLTALHKACMQGYPRIAKMLLAYGAIVEAIDNHGRSPFEVIGCDGERKPTEEERAQLEQLFQKNSNAGGKHVFSTAHPEHELGIMLQITPWVYCTKCNKRLDMKKPFYCCRQCPKLALCAGCALGESDGAGGLEELGDKKNDEVVPDENLFTRIFLSCHCQPITWK